MFSGFGSQIAQSGLLRKRSGRDETADLIAAWQQVVIER
jgi:hypothetical protein